jgi:thymidylate kinase
MELEVLKVCIDGSDCSGKTSLWNKIHKISHYRWKLEDRSFVTMVVYARLHGRKKLNDYRRQLVEDLSNLNNKYILMNPSWKTIESRYLERGDDLHDIDALRKIHAIYAEEIEKISNLPNVLVLNGEDDINDLALKAHMWLQNQENVSIADAVSLIQRHVSGIGTGEVSPLRFSLIDDGNYSEDDAKILDYEYVRQNFDKIKPATVEEFNKMVNTFMNTIDKEVRGDNIYGAPQSLSSRRFIFHQEACVSFVQALYRDDMLKFHVMCRSSHVIDVFPADIRLLYHMCHRAHKSLNLPKGTRAQLNFTLNSAHLVT